MENNENLNNQVNEKNVGQVSQSNDSKALIIIMALIIIGLAGYIVYTKFIQKNDNPEPKPNNTQEKECNCQKCEECEKCDSNTSQCNCSNSTTSCLGDKITSLKKINLTTTNQDIKIGGKTFKIRKNGDGVLYVNDQEIYVEGSTFVADNVYLTDKYLFATVVGQFNEGIWYAIGEQGEIGINNGGYTMQDFKVVDGYLHATGGIPYSNGYDLDVDMKDLLIKFIDNTLIVTYAK